MSTANDSSTTILAPAIALMRERFPDGVDLYLECFCNSDWAVGPAYVARRLSADFLSLVDTAATAVKTHGWAEVSLNNGPSEVAKSDLEPRYWNVQVCDDGMWFRGMPKEGNEYIESRHLPLEHLSLALGVDELASWKDDKLLPEYFRWHGGVLVFGTSDVDDLCEMISEKHPEIEARVNAIEMQLVIDKDAAAPAQDDVNATGATRRRMGL